MRQSNALLSLQSGGRMRLWRIGFRHFILENDEQKDPVNPVNPVKKAFKIR